METDCFSCVLVWYWVWQRVVIVGKQRNNETNKQTKEKQRKCNKKIITSGKSEECGKPKFSICGLAFDPSGDGKPTGGGGMYGGGGRGRD